MARRPELLCRPLFYSNKYIPLRRNHGNHPLLVFREWSGINFSMKILVLGAPGRTGKLVLKRALEKGYEVNGLARNSSRIEKRDGRIEEGLEIIDSELIDQ